MYRVMTICPVDPRHNKLTRTQVGKALGWATWIGNTIIGLILLVLAVAGAWRWYDSHLKAQSKNQMMETAARDVRETAECHLELRPGLTETDLGHVMEARGYVFVPGCTEATPKYNLGYKFNSICWRKN
jgi:hypothetical protein